MEQPQQTNTRFLLQCLKAVVFALVVLGVYVVVTQLLWLLGTLSLASYVVIFSGRYVFNPFVGLGVPLVFIFLSNFSVRFLFPGREKFFRFFISFLLGIGFLIVVPFLYRYQVQNFELRYAFRVGREQALYEKALAKNDPRLCRRLSNVFPHEENPPARDKCLGILAGRTGNSDLCRCEGSGREPNFIDSDQYCVGYKPKCVKEMVFVSGDPKFCSLFSGQNAWRSEQCLLDLARSFRNDKICDLLSDGQQWKSSCIFELAPERATLQSCTTKDQQMNPECVTRLAVSKKDWTLCKVLYLSNSGVRDSSQKYHCVVEAASSEELNIENACSGIFGRNLDHCVLRVALKKRDVSLCNDIVAQDYRESCLSMVGVSQ